MSARLTDHLYLVTVLRCFMILRVPLGECTHSVEIQKFQESNIWWNPGNPGSAKCPEVQKDFLVYATLHQLSVAWISEW